MPPSSRRLVLLLLSISLSRPFLSWMPAAATSPAPPSCRRSIPPVAPKPPPPCSNHCPPPTRWPFLLLRTDAQPPPLQLNSVAVGSPLASSPWPSNAVLPPLVHGRGAGLLCPAASGPTPFRHCSTDDSSVATAAEVAAAAAIVSSTTAYAVPAEVTSAAARSWPRSRGSSTRPPLAPRQQPPYTAAVDTPSRVGQPPRVPSLFSRIPAGRRAPSSREGKREVEYIEGLIIVL